jgi:hypothetical protein
MLGALFGFLLGLPVANPALHIIYYSIYYNDTNQDAVKAVVSAENIALMVMPFLIGFSINLVLALFGRFILVVQTLFGISTRT